MRQLKYALIFVVFLLTGCNLLVEILFDNDANNIQESFTGIDRDLWHEFVYLTNLPDCDLPCWWGLQIGGTNLQQVLDFIQEREFDRLQRRQTATNFTPEVWIQGDGYTLEFTGRGPSGIGDVDFFFSFDDEEMLQTILLRMRSPHRWLPDDSNPLLISNVLNDVETMPIVLISAPRNARISDFTLILVYPENHFQILYRLDISEAYPLICFNSENIGDIDLRITNLPDDLLEISDTFIPIEGSWLVQDSSITTETFVQFFRDNPNSCLDITQYP